MMPNIIKKFAAFLKNGNVQEKYIFFVTLSNLNKTSNRVVT